MKAITFGLACLFSTVIASKSYSASPCDAALVKSTYSSSSRVGLDWRLAELVDERTYNEIKQSAGGSAIIYGVPAAANYDEYRKKITSYKHSTDQSLSYTQQLNIAWTGLDPLAPSAYADCLKAERNKLGLHAFVVGATETDISVQLSWNVPGFPTAGIAAEGPPAAVIRRFPAELGQGERTVVVPRPTSQITLAVNSSRPLGYTSTIVLEPLPSPAPSPPLPTVAEIGGTWLFGGINGKRCSIAVVTGTNQLELTNEAGHRSSGARTDNVSLVAYSWNNLSGRITTKGKVIIWNNASWWSRVPLAEIESEESGRALQGSWRIAGHRCAIEGAENNLTFTNERGAKSKGRFLDASTVEAQDWGGLKGKLINNGSAILWADGHVWER